MPKRRRVCVLGAGGFIGGHLVTALKREGCWVRGVDLKRHEYKPEEDADEFILADLRNPRDADLVIDDSIEEVWQLAADMGGATYIFTGENDADIMHNSTAINLNVLESCVRHLVPKVFYASSACVYPEHNQMDAASPDCREDTAYPAHPDSEYGWEKLYAERLYAAYARQHRFTVKIARFHNIYGPMGTYSGGREKAPAAMCRKVAEAAEGGTIEVHGDGLQTRSFLHVSACVEAMLVLMASPDFDGPVNIGSEEMVSINELAQMAIDCSGKALTIRNLPAHHGTGVRGRNSHNALIRDRLGVDPRLPLAEGLADTYRWIAERVRSAASSSSPRETPKHDIQK